MPDDTTGRDWTAMRRQDFDADEPLSLFDPTPRMARQAPAGPDPLGTPDLFTTAEETGPTTG